jgi:hypothetical protein
LFNTTTFLDSRIQNPLWKVPLSYLRIYPDSAITFSIFSSVEGVNLNFITHIFTNLKKAAASDSGKNK